MSLKETSPKFFELIESGNLSDISLTIYYMDPFTLTRLPVKIDDLISGKYDSKKIVIDGNRLKEHIDLINRLNHTALKKVIKKSYVNARLYYVFETDKNGNMFDICMGTGNGNSIFVNGIEVKYNDIFFDIIIPFLPEDDIQDFEKWLGQEN